MLIIFKPNPLLSPRILRQVIAPPHVHTQHAFISMTSSTSSHLNVIININIISSQYHHQHPQHLISILSTSTTSHFNIINITNNRILHIYIYLMPRIHIPQVFRQHTSHIIIHNIMRLIF